MIDRAIIQCSESQESSVFVSKPLLKKIKTSLSYYIYDTWTNEILEVDDTIFQLLSDNTPELIFQKPILQSERQRAIEEIKVAKRHGYFRDDYPVIDSFPEEHIDTIVNQAIGEGPDQLILNVTERCNLRCRYCSFSGAYPFERTHSNKTMSWNVAREALDWYFKHDKRDNFSIGFYGGEPLLAFSLIKKIIEYARGRIGNMASFSMTTNGTLLTERIWSFFVAEGVRITFSLDGPASVHDRYRVGRNGHGSFSTVWTTIKKLYDSNKEYFRDSISFNMVLAPPVKMREINKFIEDNPSIFDNSTIMVTPVNPHPSEVQERLGLKCPYHGRSKETQETEEIYNSFKKTLIERGQTYGLPGAYYAREFVSIHQRPMTVMSPRTASHGQCIPGHRKCFVSTDGIFYMCERVSPAYSIGTVWSGIDLKVVREFLKSYNRFFNDECQKCWAVRLCQKCFNNVRIGDEWSCDRMKKLCHSRRTNLHHLLTVYCEIRETRDDAFKWAEDIAMV